MNGRTLEAIISEWDYPRMISGTKADWADLLRDID